MIGPLHPYDIGALLHRHHVGRLACLADGRPYVVPISYVYAGGLIYGYAQPGRKLSALRSDPRVCFEVDEQEDATTWRSVVADGTFEEVTDPVERKVALSLLAESAPPMVAPSAGAPGVVFRLRLTGASGRFARRAPTPPAAPRLAATESLAMA
ncbi:MAG TPA: pyridoxamine 5'-phosphate oxidase family protein [Thermomicrobiales bacterium]